MNTRSLQSEYRNTIFALLILKIHIICVLSRLKRKSMICLIPLIIRHEYAWLSLNCLKLKWALCSHFVRPHWKYTNRGSFVCHFDECPGHFHRVQMWGSRDPSWFQESIAVRKGRVNVHLLAWRDTEPAQKERQTTDLTLGLCVFLNFYIDPTVHRHVSLSHCLFSVVVSIHSYIFLLRRNNPASAAFVMSPEGPLDCRNMKKMLAIAGVLSLLDAGALSYW